MFTGDYFTFQVTRVRCLVFRCNIPLHIQIIDHRSWKQKVEAFKGKCVLIEALTRHDTVSVKNQYFNIKWSLSCPVSVLSEVVISVFISNHFLCYTHVTSQITITQSQMRSSNCCYCNNVILAPSTSTSTAVPTLLPQCTAPAPSASRTVTKST